MRTPKSQMRKPSVLSVSAFAIKTLLLAEEKGHRSEGLTGASKAICCQSSISLKFWFFALICLLHSLCISVWFDIKVMFLIISEIPQTVTPHQKKNLLIKLTSPEGAPCIFWGFLDPLPADSSWTGDTKLNQKAGVLVSWWPFGLQFSFGPYSIFKFSQEKKNPHIRVFLKRVLK